MPNNVQIVKSVEHLETGFLSGQSTSSIGLSKGQDTSNCVPFYTMRGYNSQYADRRANWYYDVYFSGNNVVCARGHTDWDHYIDIYVVEFDPAYVDVQQGSFSMPDGGNVYQTVNETLSSGIDLDKTWVTAYHTSDYSDSYHRRHEVMHKLTSTTNLEFTRYIRDTGNISGHYYLAQSDYFNVQQIELTQSSPDTYETATISGVADREKTFLVSSVRCDITGSEEVYGDEIANEIWLDDSETLRVQTGRADNGDRDYCVYVVELDYEPVASGTYSGKHVQHNQIVQAGADLITYTNLAEQVGDSNFATPICSSTRNLARCADNNQSGSNWAKFYHKTRLVNDGTQLETERVQTSTNPAYTRIQTVQWWTEETEEVEQTSGQVVESIEIIEVTLPHGSYSISEALTKGQNTANCVPFVTQRDDQYNVGYYASNRYLDVYFSGSNIVFEKENNNGPNYIVCYVVEFNPALINVQQLSLSMGATGRNVTQTVNTTITAVDPSRSFVVVPYTMEYISDQFVSRREVMSYFTGPTNVAHSRWNGATGAITGHVYVVEALSDHLVVQHLTLTKEDSETSVELSIDEVDQTRTFIMTTLRGHGNSGIGDDRHNWAGAEVYFPSDTTIKVQTDPSPGWNFAADYHCQIITLNYNYASGVELLQDMVQRGRMILGSGEATDSDTVGSLNENYVMLCHSSPRIGGRLDTDASGSGTTAMVTTLSYDNDFDTVTAQRERTNYYPLYLYYQHINWHVNVTEEEDPDEDQPDKVATINLTQSNPGYRMDVKTIKMDDGTFKDVLVVVGQAFIYTYDVDDPTNPVKIGSVENFDDFDYLGGFDVTNTSFGSGGPHTAKIIDATGSPKAGVLYQGEQNLTCCTHFGISMDTWVARDSVVYGYVSPVCENSSISVSPYGDAISSADYDPSTGLITLNISDVACGHGIITISDDNTCCTYSVSHAVAVTTYGVWCNAGFREAWYLQCTTNTSSCTCTYYEGIYRKSWYTGWGHPGSCLGVGDIPVGCGCGYYGGDNNNYCPCSSSTTLQYVEAGNPPHCDGCTAGAHVANVSLKCWSSGCTCESGKYDHQC